MNILEEIVNSKYAEVVQRKGEKTVAQLEKSPFFEHKTISLKEYLLRADKTGIIAEFKRRSPSKGLINGTSSVEDVTQAYAKFGASCLSVLTDYHYFGGCEEDLITARKVNSIPILRKDFIVDEYQLLEAKAMGADVILLIAASLETQQLKNLAQFAKSLGLEVLLELHAADELSKICDSVDVVGVNNRNLKTFSVDIQHSIELYAQIPDEFIKISESGISEVQTIQLLKQVGFKGFLIGENFMKTSNPALAFQNFVNQLNNYES